MIVAFCGHTQSGKTTMCKMFHHWMRNNTRFKKIHYIDADKVTYVFEKSGRKLKKNPIELHALASDIAIYEKSINEVILLALPFDEPEYRNRIDSENTLWLWMDATGSARDQGIEQKKPENAKTISTSDNTTPEQSFEQVCQAFNNFMLNTIYVKK